MEKKAMDQISNPISNYISQFPEAQQKVMLSVREHIQKVLPNAIEKISYGMPTFWDKKNIIHFTANKAHLGIYPGPACIHHFAEEIKEKEFAFSKAAVQFPWDRMIPLDLIQRMAFFSYQNTQK